MSVVASPTSSSSIVRCPTIWPSTSRGPVREKSGARDDSSRGRSRRLVGAAWIPAGFIRVRCAITRSTTPQVDAEFVGAESRCSADLVCHRRPPVTDPLTIAEEAPNENCKAGARPDRTLALASPCTHSTGSSSSFSRRSIASAFCSSRSSWSFCVPGTTSGPARVPAARWILIALTLVALSWPLVDFKQFVYRAADRRSTSFSAPAILRAGSRARHGWILPATAAAVHRLRLGETDSRSHWPFAHRASRLRLIGWSERST